MLRTWSFSLAPLVVVTVLVAAPGCQRDPIVHRPVTSSGPAGDASDIYLAGGLSNIGHCEVLEIVALSDDFEGDIEDFVSVEIETPASAAEWLRTALSRSTVQLSADPWGSWLQMGSYFELPELGVSVRGQRTGSNEICAGERYAKLVIREVLGVYDIDEEVAYANPSNLLLSRDVYDLEDEDIETVFQAGLAGQQGQQGQMSIEVEGTWGCDNPELPAWRLIEPDAGYVELEYANSGVVPDEQGLLDALIAEEGIRDFTRLPEEAQQELYDEVYEMTRGGDFAYTGYFTGEVRFSVGERAVIATPVFMVTGVVPED